MSALIRATRVRGYGQQEWAEMSRDQCSHECEEMNALIHGSEEMTALADTQASKRGEELSRKRGHDSSRLSQLLILLACIRASHTRKGGHASTRPSSHTNHQCSDTGKQHECGDVRKHWLIVRAKLER